MVWRQDPGAGTSARRGGRRSGAATEGTSEAQDTVLKGLLQHSGNVRHATSIMDMIIIEDLTRKHQGKDQLFNVQLAGVASIHFHSCVSNVPPGLTVTAPATKPPCPRPSQQAARGEPGLPSPPPFHARLETSKGHKYTWCKWGVNIKSRQFDRSSRARGIKGTAAKLISSSLPVDFSAPYFCNN